MAIFILRDNQQEGPYEEHEVRAALVEGSLNRDTMAWIEGLPTWQPLGELFPQPGAHPQPAAPEADVSKLGLSAIFADTFKFPFCKSGWITILVGAVFFTFAGYIPFGGLFVSGYLIAFYIDIIATSATGKDDCPDWPSFSSFADDIIRPFLQGLGASIISLLPSVALGIAGLMYQSNALLILAGLFLVWSIFYYPVAMIGVVVFGNINGALPQQVLPAFLRTFPASLILGAVNLLFLALPYGNSWMAHGYSFVGRIFYYAVYLYCLMAEARFLGLFYRREKAAFQWE